MRRKATLIGVLAGALVVLTPVTTPSVCRMVTSARNFREYFDTLDGSRTALNPLERIVFSLMLANSRTAANEKGAAAIRRTT
jgi:hypothetical protein